MARRATAVDLPVEAEVASKVEMRPVGYLVPMANLPLVLAETESAAPTRQRFRPSVRWTRPVMS